MTTDIAIDLSNQLLSKAISISLHVISVSLICGLIISVLQAATQIQDSVLSTAPKLLCIILMLMFCSEWMLNALIDFAKHIILSIPGALR